MRLVQIAEDGALELRWMWLPTFIGQNHLVLKELGEMWKAKFSGLLATDVLLDAVHKSTIEWLCEKFKIEGLEKYLAAITFVKEG